MEDPYWQSFMEQAVRLIYFLAESPDQLCSRLLQRSARLLLDQIAEGGEGNREPDQVQEGSQETNEQGEQGECFIIIYFYYYLNHDNLKVDIYIYFFLSLLLSVSCVCLAQLLALCGSVAFWQVSHLERSVSTELRRRRGESEERKEKEKEPSSKAKVENTQRLCPAN